MHIILHAYQLSECFWNIFNIIKYSFGKSHSFNPVIYRLIAVTGSCMHVYANSDTKSKYSLINGEYSCLQTQTCHVLLFYLRYVILMLGTKIVSDTYALKHVCPKLT